MSISSKKEIPFWSVDVGGSELDAIGDVLASSYLNEGLVNAKFEQLIAEYLGVSEVVTTTSGTSALYMSLLALDIGHGDEVVVPDMTFAATINAVCLTGATPVVADVSYDSALMSLDHLEAAIGPRTKAVIPVHIAGRLSINEEFLEITRNSNVRIIEDAAEAFMSRGRLGLAGAIGDCGCFSLSPNKLVTTGQGGFITTNDKRLGQRLRSLKNQGRIGQVTGGGDDRYVGHGLNCKLTDVQAAIGIVQLGRIWDRIESQKKKYEKYTQGGLRDLEALSFYQYRPDEVPLWTDVKIKHTATVERFKDHLSTKGVEVRKYWRPLSETFNGLRAVTSGVAHKISNESVWLPSAFSLSDGDLQYVIDEVIGFFDE